MNKREAAIVRYIFGRYEEGAGGSVIARELQKKGALKKNGESDWKPEHILGILENVKYKGDLVMGSTYTIDPISKKRVKNQGEQDRYYVENHHEPIISRELFDEVQEIRRKRTEKHKAEVGSLFEGRRYPFSGIAKCGYCGSSYTRKTIHGNTERYRKYIWACSNYQKYGKKTCPHCKVIREEILEGAFVESFKKLCQSEENIELIRKSFRATFDLVNTSDYSEHLGELRKQLKKQTDKRQKLVDLLITDTITNDVFDKKVSGIDSQIANIRNRIAHFEVIDKRAKDRQKSLDALEEKLKRGKSLTYFDPDLFEAAIERITIGGYDENGDPDPYRLELVLRNGETHLHAGRDYVPQRRNAVARQYPEEFREKDYFEICHFKYYSQYFKFARSEDGMRKVLLDGVDVRIMWPVVRVENEDEAAESAD